MSLFMRQRYSINLSSDCDKSVSDNDLQKINGLTRNGPLMTLTSDDVFVRRMYILGEEPTSRMSIHPEGKKGQHCLSALRDTLAGCPMLDGHRVDKAGWGRIFDAEVLSSVSGYEGSVLKISYYFLRIDDGERRAARIDGGIDSEGSISYRYKSAHCSICGREMMVSSFLGQTMARSRCDHSLGKMYGGETCYWYPSGLVAAEVSSVYRGAYPKTRSLLSFDDLPKTRSEMVAAYQEDESAAVEYGLGDAVIAYASEVSDSNWSAVVKRYSMPIKPLKSGAQNNEFFELSGFSSLDGVHYIEPKYDGIFMVMSKNKGKATLQTDSGADHTEKFPAITAELEAMDIENCVLHGEMVKYSGRRRGTHSDVSAYLASKGPYEDYHFRFKPIDIAYLNGDVVATKPLTERKKSMKSIKSTAHIHPVKYQVANSGKEIVDLIPKVSTREGAMIKSAEMTLDDSGRKLIYKWKRQRGVDALVDDIESVDGSFVYTCSVGDSSERTEIGKTYRTSVKAKKGDIILVFVDHVTYDESSKKFTWYAPKVDSVRDDKSEPDPLSTLKRISESKNPTSRATFSDVCNILKNLDLGIDLYLCGGVVTNGGSEHDIDIVTQSELSDDDVESINDAFGDLSDMLDLCVNSSGPDGSYVKYASKVSNSYAKRFVLQRHWWGNAEHYDLRFGSPDGRRMWGFTCFKKPSTVSGGSKVQCEEKDYHDVKWMGFEGKIKPGDPGNPTKNLVAQMKIVDGGQYEFVKRTTDFLEVVLHGSDYKGRYVFRKISTKAPASDKEDESKGKGTIWVMWKPVDQQTSSPVKNIGFSEKNGVMLFWEI